ncbi:MAG: hypothetical protein KJ850_00840 [Gammaproteobacteria bacterium]|nr:hypothetical protein [Gammaproteobacteria bacterium]MBU1623568.1 hypothetical protein [Gammaproteobacteria bacterium]
MRRFYTGLLFFGASFGTHAVETHKHSHAAKHAPVAMHYTQHVPETHEHNSVVYSDFKADNSKFSAPQLATTDRYTAALTRSQKNLVNVLSALHFQRMSLQNAQMKLSLSPGSAVMETEHLKVAVQSDSTSVTWNKTF